jgi:hypothetical protein
VVNLGDLLINKHWIPWIPIVTFFVDKFCYKLHLYFVDEMGEGTYHVQVES